MLKTKEERLEYIRKQVQLNEEINKGEYDYKLMREIARFMELQELKRTRSLKRSK